MGDPQRTDVKHMYIGDTVHTVTSKSIGVNDKRGFGLYRLETK